MAQFAMRLASKLIEVHSLHDQVERLCSDYLVEEHACAPDLVVRVSQADIDREREKDGECGHSSYSDAYLETLAVYRQIAEWAPPRGLMLMHGAVVEHAGRAYLFTAPSGTGKSTHVRLWRSFLGDAVRIINGDKPLVSVALSGASPVVAYGTPWAGKEGWQRNASAPLAGVCFLSQAERCSIARISPVEAFDAVMRQVYLPSDGAALVATMDLLDAFLRSVPAYRMACDMSEDAVRCSFETLTGESFEEARRAGGQTSQGAGPACCASGLANDEEAAE